MVVSEYFCIFADKFTFLNIEPDNEALVIADTENLSLAIGKKGVNIKLASRLTKVKINIKTLEDINKEINEK